MSLGGAGSDDGNCGNSNNDALCDRRSAVRHDGGWLWSTRSSARAKRGA
jgi:hypothetical protein